MLRVVYVSALYYLKEIIKYPTKLYKFHLSKSIRKWWRAAGELKCMAAALHRFWLADVCWNDYLTTSKNWSFSDIRASRGISRTEMRTGSRLFVLKGPQSSSTRCVFICSQQRSVYLPGSWIEFCDDIFPRITEGATCPRWFQGCAESTLSSSQHLLQLVAPAPFLSLCPWCWKPPFYPETSISI